MRNHAGKTIGLGVLAGMACAAALALSGRGWADIVYLKNTTAMRGEVVASDEKTVTLKVAFGKVIIERDQIDRIVKEDDLKGMLADAKRLEMSGDEAGAEGRYSEILKRSPENETARKELARILHKRARMLLMAQKVAEAEPVLKRLVEVDPADTFGKEELGQIEDVHKNAGNLEKEAVLLARIGRGQESIAKFERLISVMPEVADRDAKFIAMAHNREGDLLLAVDRFREAGAHYDEAVKADPNLAKTLAMRRLLSILEPIARERKEHKEDLPKARWEGFIPELEAAEKIAPDNPLPAYYLGEVYVKLGQLREAGACFERVTGKALDEKDLGPSLQRLYNLSGDKVRTIRLSVSLDDMQWKEVARNIKVLETPHFNIYYYNRELADLAAEAAEYFYGRTYRELAGKAPEKVWSPKCGVFLYATHEEYLKESGQEKWSDSNAKTVSAEGVLKNHCIMTCQSAHNLLSSQLPHEMTHIVQSAMFGYSTRIPLWLKEGLAVHSEPWFKRRSMAEVIRKEIQTTKAFTLEELTQTKVYPPDETRVRMFYAESLGMVEALLEQKGGIEAFNRFTQLSSEEPFEQALKEVYGLNMKEAEKIWKQHLDAIQQSLQANPK